MSQHILEENLFVFELDKYNSYEEIIKQINNVKIVMLGEATHGTYEFYYIRKQLTEYLVQEKGFNAIAIEGDVTSCYNINLFLQGEGKINDVLNALTKFKRFPTWMWRNNVIVDLLKNLRRFNDSTSQKVHFFGLDLYSMHGAIQAVINFLEEYDPEAALDAIKRYSCFENTTHNPQEYGALVKYAHKKACIEEVARQVIALQQTVFHNHGNLEEADKLFYAMQNALLVKNAELYYRSMFEPHQNTWNIRDEHMFEILKNILDYLSNTLKTDAKVIIWAHNSHLGNAKATDMSLQGELNIGQLIKEHYPTSSFSLGFSTNTGTVVAADNWGEEPKIKQLNPGINGSYEKLFHKTQCKNFLLTIKNNSDLFQLLSTPRLQRAIGVIYRPDTERYSHYYMANLAHQFDALLHIDESRAICAI